MFSSKMIKRLLVTTRVILQAVRVYGTYEVRLRKEEAANFKSIYQENQKQLATVIQQLDALMFKYASPENRDGEYINAQEYSRMKSALLKEKSRLEDELNTQGKEKEEWLDMSERTFNFARYAGIWFAKGDDSIRRAIFACLGSSLVLSSQNIDITLRKPFEMIFTCMPEAQREFARLEPQEIQINATQFFTSLQQLPIWSG